MKSALRDLFALFDLFRFRIATLIAGNLTERIWGAGYFAGYRQGSNDTRALEELRAELRDRFENLSPAERNRLRIVGEDDAA